MCINLAIDDLLAIYHIHDCHSINKLNLLSLNDCLMIVIMVALPQLNCGRAPLLLWHTPFHLF